jgi:N,N'-diacetyllegionaminate synthase
MVKNKSIEIVAEVAQGYLGKFDLCKTYILSSAKAGANAVKFQLVYADELATKDYKYYKLFKSLEIKFNDWKKLKKIAKQNNVDIYFDIFGKKSLSVAENLGVKGIKVHPTDLTNYNLLKEVHRSKINKIIIGVGGFPKNDILKAVQIVKNSNNKICIMHGFQGYPTLNQDNDLGRVLYLKNFYNYDKHINYGFADHVLPSQSNSHLASVLAVGIGCTVIEKHITISKVLKMEDYESAYNPDEFKDFISIIRESEMIINRKNLNKFKLSKKEKKYSSAIIRNFIAIRNIKKNSILKNHMFNLKRSPNPKALKSTSNIENKITKRNIKKNNPLQKADI